MGVLMAMPLKLKRQHFRIGLMATTLLSSKVGQVDTYLYELQEGPIHPGNAVNSTDMIGLKGQKSKP